MMTLPYKSPKNGTFKQYSYLVVFQIISSGTDEVWAKREASLCNESVNGHFFWSNLRPNCIFKWTWFVKTDIWTFPVAAALIFFFLFSPIFLPFFTRFLFCSTRISKVGKCPAFQLWTPTYFFYILRCFCIEKLIFSRRFWISLQSQRPFKVNTKASPVRDWKYFEIADLKSIIWRVCYGSHYYKLKIDHPIFIKEVHWILAFDGQF